MKSYKDILTDYNLNHAECFIYNNLSESFDINKTPYGTNLPNLDNGNVITNNRSIVTYFKMKDKVIKVRLDKTNKDTVYFKFLTSHVLDNLDNDNFKIGDEYSYMNTDALVIFNKCIYVTLELSEINNIQNIVFEGASKNLTRVYNTLTKNKRVLSKFRNYGWVFDPTEKELYKFTKQ